MKKRRQSFFKQCHEKNGCATFSGKDEQEVFAIGIPDISASSFFALLKPFMRTRHRVTLLFDVSISTRGLKLSQALLVHISW